MKRFTSLMALAILASGLSTAKAEVKYWDITGATPGATNGDGIGDGTWDGAATNWNTDPTGGGGGAISAWTTTTDDAVFSAGSDVSTDPLTGGAFITISGTQLANSVLIEDGYVKFVSGTADTGAGAVTINAGATLALASTSQLNLTAGKVVLNGGTLMGTNPGNAGSFIGSGAGLKGLEVNGTGTIGYSDGNVTPDNQVSIFFGVITGTGGTVDNGGAGTLIKTGPDQIGIGAFDADPGAGVIPSHTLFTFAKLKVIQGAYRARNVTVASVAYGDERVFGAVPLAPLADAITLDGGGIGSNITLTLSANRGITIGSNGGYFDHGAGASLIIPGSLSGSGTLSIGSPTSSAVTAPGFTLSNANNVNTFSGALVGVRGLLTLSASLKVAGLRDSVGAVSGANVATINIASGQTLTTSTASGTDTWSTAIGGAGGLTKVGGGTQVLAGTPTYSGDTHVVGGTLSIANPYLANAADVYLGTGSIFDLTFAATDTIDSLFVNGVSQAIGLWGAVGNAGATFTTPLITGTGLLQVSTFVSAGTPGDYNNNGVVDAADYVAWRNAGPTDTLPNDPTPGTVDASDYTTWQANFGKPPGSGSGSSLGAVPEPATLLMLMAGLAMVAVGRRRS